MSHDVFAGMAAGYALSALDADEMNRFEAHLAACPECQVSLAGMRQLVDALSMISEEAEPAPGLRERILESARAEPSGPESASPSRRTSQACPILGNRFTNCVKAAGRSSCVFGMVSSSVSAS